MDYYVSNIDNLVDGFLNVNKSIRIYVDRSAYEDMVSRNNFTVTEATYISYQVRGVSVNLSINRCDYPLINEVLEAL